MNKNVIKITENELKRIVNESVQTILSELNWKTYANAAAAAKDRESIFKDSLGYPWNPMVKHHKKDGSVDWEQYDKDSQRSFNQSKQPEKFRQEAYRGLSREVCGEDDFFKFIGEYVSKNGMDDNMKKMLQAFMDGDSYIKNNKTQWSRRREE